MSRARNRPPRLEPHEGEARPAPPPTLEALLERARIAGAGSGPGPTEFRRTVEGLATGERRVLGELAPLARITVADVWLAIKDAYGATADNVVIDAARTVAATYAAAARVREVAATGARVALATAHPASLMTLHLAFAALARDHGGDVIDLADFGPIRADGRMPRWLRWIGGVAVVSDGDALCATRDGDAAREWTFAIPRPSLVVADGPFAEAAWEAGIEVVALAGLDRPGVAVAGSRHGRCTVVPLRTDRPARAYALLEDLVARPGPPSDVVSDPPPDAPFDPPPDAPFDPPPDPGM